MAFGKTQKETPAVQPSQKLEPYDMHVMPTKFHQYLSAKSKSSTSKLILVIALVVFVLTMLGIGGYFLYLQMNQPVQTENLNTQPAPEPENLNIIEANANLSEENLNLEPEVNINENINVPENVNVNENTNTALNENENANINTNTNTSVEIINYSSSVDSDGDKLTDVEEDLYQTEKRKPDTDEDGYLDGAEVIGGFNPKAAGGSKLETSGLVNKYTNPLYNFSVLYPTSWLARPEDQSLKVILLLTASEEFMKISIEDNPDNLDIVDWYLRLSPGADLNLLERITTPNGFQALSSPDKLNYYLVDTLVPDKVFVLTYNIGTLSEINYLSTYEMMLKSFTVNQTPNNE